MQTVKCHAQWVGGQKVCNCRIPAHYIPSVSNIHIKYSMEPPLQQACHSIEKVLQKGSQFCPEWTQEFLKSRTWRQAPSIEMPVHPVLQNIHWTSIHTCVRLAPQRQGREGACFKQPVLPKQKQNSSTH